MKLSELLNTGTVTADEYIGRRVMVTNVYYTGEPGTILEYDADALQFKVKLDKYPYYPCYFSAFELTVPDKTREEPVTSCHISHKFELYIGLTESYNHCVRCGAKESDVKVQRSNWRDY